MGAVTCIAVHSQEVCHLPTVASTITQTALQMTLKRYYEKQNRHDFKTTDLNLNIYFLLQKGKKFLANTISSVNIL